MCPTCHTTLDQSNSPIAQPHEGATSGTGSRAARPRREIKASSSRSFGAGDPRRAAAARASTCSRGCCRSRRSLVGASRVAFGVWRWSRARGARRAAGAGRALDPETRAPGRRGARTVGLMGVAARRSRSSPGFVSVLTPCVLPLVPGYLSARLRGRGRAARRARLGAAGRARERSVRARLHGRLRRARHRRRSDRRAGARQVPAQSESRASSSSSSGSRSWACCRGRSASSRRASYGRAPPRLARRCSAARSRSALRRASARCSRAILVLAGDIGHRRCRARSCSPLLARPRRPLRARGARSPGRWGLPLAARPLRAIQFVERRDHGRARPAALLRPRLVAARRAEPRAGGCGVRRRHRNVARPACVAPRMHVAELWRFPVKSLRG